MIEEFLPSSADDMAVEIEDRGNRGKDDSQLSVEVRLGAQYFACKTGNSSGPDKHIRRHQEGEEPAKITEQLLPGEDSGEQEGFSTRQPEDLQGVSACIPARYGRHHQRCAQAGEHLEGCDATA